MGDLAIWIGFAGVLVGLLPGLINSLINRGKVRSDSAGTLVQTALNLLPAQTSIINRLQAELDEAHHEHEQNQMQVERLKGIVTYLRVGVARLLVQLNDAGLKPVWKPRPEDFGDQREADNERDR